MPEWYRDTSALLFRILCFIADFQEPYVLLRYHPDTPLFDERFKNYGYNKVQLFEHLRAMSYRFYIWNQRLYFFSIRGNGNEPVHSICFQ